MSWINPVPRASVTRGFGPTFRAADEGAYADLRQGIAHDFAAGIFPSATWYRDFHAALDMAAAIGTPIYAPQDGLVLDAKWGIPGSWANDGGNFLRVEVNPTCMWLVAHCNRLLVSTGQRIRKGQIVATVGQTGVATGPHAHFWIRQGPKPYYDRAAFFFNPSLILPGGRLAGDARFEPGQLPDTGGIWRIGGIPVTFISQAGRTAIVKAGKPIRDGASVSARTIKTIPNETTVTLWGYTPQGNAAGVGSPNWWFYPVADGSKTVVGYSPRIDLKDFSDW